MALNQRSLIKSTLEDFFQGKLTLGEIERCLRIRGGLDASDCNEIIQRIIQISVTLDFVYLDYKVEFVEAFFNYNPRCATILDLYGNPRDPFDPLFLDQLVSSTKNQYHQQSLIRMVAHSFDFLSLKTRKPQTTVH